MIRRRQGSDFLLITQHDHALISGELAESFGNAGFASPVPREPALAGIRLHDCGWPLHDDQPTLNAEHLPIDVFESTREIAFKVWTASVERATREDLYAGLLVSLHVLALSVLAAEHAGPGGSFNLDNPQNRFAVIKFQQRELERQETLRAQLGLRTEKGAHHAVARDIRQEPEDQLQFNFALLQVMDQLSLALCCTAPPVTRSRDLPRHPGGDKIKFTFTRQGNDIVLAPWPFSRAEIEVKIPGCRVPAKTYKDDAELRAVYAGAAAEVITARVSGASA
jgi:hypothetical protein